MELSQCSLHLGVQTTVIRQLPARTVLGRAPSRDGAGIPMLDEQSRAGIRAETWLPSVSGSSGPSTFGSASVHDRQLEPGGHVGKISNWMFLMCLPGKGLF